VEPLAVTQYMQLDFTTGWENKFNSTYNEFLTYSVDLASYMEIQKVIIPTELYAFSKLNNYSNIKSMIIDQTSEFVTQTRSTYSGQFILSLKSVNEVPSSEILSLFDGFLIKTNWNLNAVPDDNAGLTNSFKNYLDQSVNKFFESTSKPIYLELEFPSALSAETGCVKFEDDCIDFDLLNLSGTELRSTIPIDLTIQTELYQAILTAINDFPWISGVISNGFNGLVAVQDATSSIRGKPAADVLWYWYPRLLGNIK
jgi:hypothetical protein